MLLLGRSNAGLGLVYRGVKARDLATDFREFTVDRCKPCLGLGVTVAMGREGNLAAFGG